jgi:hypothetical protein
MRSQVLLEQEHSGGLDNRAIEPLKDAYLVRSDKRSGSIWYELAHDRLIAPIRKNNAAWFKDNLSPLQQQADLWHRAGYPIPQRCATRHWMRRCSGPANTTPN